MGKGLAAAMVYGQTEPTQGDIDHPKGIMTRGGKHRDHVTGGLTALPVNETLLHHGRGVGPCASSEIGGTSRNGTTDLPLQQHLIALQLQGHLRRHGPESQGLGFGHAEALGVPGVQNIQREAVRKNMNHGGLQHKSGLASPAQHHQQPLPLLQVRGQIGIIDLHHLLPGKNDASLIDLGTMEDQSLLAARGVSLFQDGVKLQKGMDLHVVTVEQFLHLAGNIYFDLHVTFLDQALPAVAHVIKKNGVPSCNAPRTPLPDNIKGLAIFWQPRHQPVLPDQYPVSRLPHL